MDLTARQVEFMAVLSYQVDRSGPSTVGDLTAILGRSESGVRSLIKALTSRGWITCVGKVRKKRYVPSCRWSDLTGSVARVVGGKCETPGCGGVAVERYRKMYICRCCLIGTDDVRADHYNSALHPSVAGWDVD